MPTIIDLNAEAAKLTMFRGLTPQTTRAERKGSAAQLPPYRDGLLLLGKSAGTGHWETHPPDEHTRPRHGQYEETAEHHRSQCRAREAHDVPRADAAIDDGRSKGQQRTIG